MVDKQGPAARLRLRRACAAADDAIRASGFSSAQVAMATHIRPEAVRRLSADGEKTGWRIPSLRTCEAIDEFCATHLGKSFSLVTFRRSFDQAQEQDSSSEGALDDAEVLVGYPPPVAVAHQERSIFNSVKMVRSQIGSSYILIGNGGCGKTQTAVQFFVLDVVNSPHVKVWVTASSRQSITSTYAEAAQRLHLCQADCQEDDAASFFLQWCGSTQSPWIVVLDDVRDPVDVRGLWPKGKTGRVIMTTRRRDINYQGAERILVGVFEPSEANAYLSERLAQSEDEARPDALTGAPILCHALGYLPLALAQAASYLIYAGETCESYQELFEQNRMRLSRVFPAHALADDYSETVVTTWSLGLSIADSMTPVGLARPALELASLLHSDGIPEKIWTSSEGVGYMASCRQDSASGQENLPKNVSPEEGRLALRNLHLLSLITHDPDPAHTLHSVRVHNLVQLATLSSYDGTFPAQLMESAGKTLKVLLKISPLDRTIRRNAETLMANVGDQLLATEAWNLEESLIAGLLAGGRKSEAVERSTSFIARVESARGTRSREVLDARWHGADVYRDCGRHFSRHLGAAILARRLCGNRNLRRRL